MVAVASVTLKAVLEQVVPVAVVIAAVGPAVTVSDFVFTKLAQGPLAVTVMVSTTVAFSPTPGVYVGVKVVALLRLPVPLWLHNKEA